MAYIVSSPGSCGEFIQGYSNGTSFMVTCPINRYSYAWVNEKTTESLLPGKAQEAVKKTLECLNYRRNVSIGLQSVIPYGKGMASSTADISAVCQATAIALGKRLTDMDIAQIALSIEPSDATFFEGIMQFDYREGTLIRRLGHAPIMNILIYDCGGEIDTLLFNSRSDLLKLQQENETEIKKAFDLFLHGMEQQSLEDIGKAATMSAYANQKILYKKSLDEFYSIGTKAGGKGVICAHSGTVLGLIVSIEDDISSIKKEMDEIASITYLDSVTVTNEGMQIRKGNIDDFIAK